MVVVSLFWETSETDLSQQAMNAHALLSMFEFPEIVLK